MIFKKYFIDRERKRVIRHFDKLKELEKTIQEDSHKETHLNNFRNMEKILISSLSLLGSKYDSLNNKSIPPYFFRKPEITITNEYNKPHKKNIKVISEDMWLVYWHTSINDIPALKKLNKINKLLSYKSKSKLNAIINKSLNEEKVKKIITELLISYNEKYKRRTSLNIYSDSTLRYNLDLSIFYIFERGLQNFYNRFLFVIKYISIVLSDTIYIRIDEIKQTKRTLIIDLYDMNYDDYKGFIKTYKQYLYDIQIKPKGNKNERTYTYLE